MALTDRQARALYLQDLIFLNFRSIQKDNVSMRVNIPSWIFAFSAALISVILFLALVYPGRGISFGPSVGEIRLIARDDQSKNLFPIGAIVASAVQPAAFLPANPGWRLADGSAASEGSEYAKIAGAFLPDLRGVFLRGMNMGRNDSYSDPDSGRPAGSFQDDAISEHTHDLLVVVNGYPDSSGDRIGNSAYYLVHPSRNGNRQNMTTSIPNSSLSETRPANVSVYYYIYVG